jgi:hypothetical protein
VAADLDALRELYAFMRDSGDVTHARCGELELRRELPPAPPVHVHVAEPPSPPDDEAEDERRSLEMLLHSSGVDAGSLMRALGRPRAA